MGAHEVDLVAGDGEAVLDAPLRVRALLRRRIDLEPLPNRLPVPERRPPCIDTVVDRELRKLPYRELPTPSPVPVHDA